MSTRYEGFTPGEWEWSNSGGQHPTLFTKRRRLVVMDFVRMGMNGAQPRFSDRNGELRGGLMHKWGDRNFNEHPDALLIADAPTLLGRVQELEAAIARHVEALDALPVEALRSGISMLDRRDVKHAAVHLTAALTWEP